METLMNWLCAFGVAWICFPFMQSIGELLMTVVEVAKAKLSILIAKSNVEMQQIQDSMEKTYSSVIGFEAPHDDTEEEWEDEPEPQDKVIGFNMK